LPGDLCTDHLAILSLLPPSPSPPSPLHRYDKRTNKAQKPIKYAKSTTQSHHHLPPGQQSSSSGGYTIGHADLAAAFAEQDALSNAAGFHHLHQHQQLHNPQVCLVVLLDVLFVCGVCCGCAQSHMDFM